MLRARTPRTLQGIADEYRYAVPGHIVARTPFSQTREPENPRSAGQPLLGRGRQVVSVSILLRVSQEPRVIPNFNTILPIAHCTCQPDDDGTGKINVRTVISAQSELGRW